MQKQAIIFDIRTISEGLLLYHHHNKNFGDLVLKGHPWNRYVLSYLKNKYSDDDLKKYNIPSGIQFFSEEDLKEINILLKEKNKLPDEFNAPIPQLDNRYFPTDMNIIELHSNSPEIFKYDMENFIFPFNVKLRGDISMYRFKNTIFLEKIITDNAKFQNNVNFENAQFYGDVNFDNAEFLKDTNFKGAIFHEEVSFKNAQFKGKVYFEETKQDIENVS